MQFEATTIQGKGEAQSYTGKHNKNVVDCSGALKGPKKEFSENETHDRFEVAYPR